MAQVGKQSYVLDAVIGILSTIVGNFIYDNVKALNWSRIKPLLVRVAIEVSIFIGAGAVALLMIFYL
jgi:hypothetical protein